MLKEILSVSGKPGLYKLISQGRNSLIVEAISADKKRMPIYGSDKVISLGDIAMYTEESEEPLAKIMASICAKNEGKPVELDWKKASRNELEQFFAEILPDFDRDRVHMSDIKKLIQWYNLLVTNGITEFEVAEETAKEPVAGPVETEPVAAGD